MRGEERKRVRERGRETGRETGERREGETERRERERERGGGGKTDCKNWRYRVKEGARETREKKS